jgi:uncharacterized membrane protein HdeD (DUF308 family)
MTIHHPELDHFTLGELVHKRWGLFFAEGVILLLLGAAAIIIPPLATLAVAIFIGWLLLISGIVGLFTTIWMRTAPGFVWSLVSAVLGIVAGAILLASPVSGAVSLTLVLIAFFVIEGVASIMYAFDHREELTGTWTWMLVSGLVDLVLAAMIYAGLPGSAAWAIGLLVGINMLFGGVSLIAMALHARRLEPTTQH